MNETSLTLAAVGILTVLFAMGAHGEVVRPMPRPEPGTSVYVRDGDTLVVNGQPWRLSGVNCPESGDSATQLLENIIDLTLSVRCDWDGGTTYDRKTGHCSVADAGKWYDLGALMIASGECGRCARYDPDGLYIDAAEVGDYSGPVPGYCK